MANHRPFDAIGFAEGSEPPEATVRLATTLPASPSYFHSDRAWVVSVART